MARGLRLNALRRPGFAWLLLAALLAVGSLVAWFLPTAFLDWQPDLVVSEPWRWWTAAFVHWSPLHLGANLLGTALVAALGWAGRLPARTALAWFIAWPLLHLLLLGEPALAHYGGLSGVLHAGVAAAAVELVCAQRGRPRAIGAALLVGLAAKIGLEAPWGPPLRHPADWDIAIAPLAHATGVLAGGGAALLSWWLQRQSRR